MGARVDGRRKCVMTRWFAGTAELPTLYLIPGAFISSPATYDDAVIHS